MDPENTESLLRRALAGDKTALHELVARLTPVIQARVARTLLARRALLAGGRDLRQEMENLNQEILLALFARDAHVLRGWQAERGLSLENFVGLVAERQVLSFLRSGRRNPQQEDASPEDDLEFAAPDSGPEEVTASREHLSRLLDRMRQEVSPLGRRLFDLLYVQELSPTEVMTESGLSADAVYAWRSRLRRLARKSLAEMSESPVSPRSPLDKGIRDAQISHSGDQPPILPPSGGNPTLPPEPPQLFLQGRLPARVRLGDTVTLQARIALQPGSDRSEPLRNVAVPPEGLHAILVLHAPGFEALEGNQRPVIIPYAASSDWVPFPMKAVRPGVHSAEVSAYTSGGSFLGSLDLEVAIDPSVSTGESQEHRQPMRRRLAEDEVTLRIRFDHEARVYRFQLFDGSPVPPDEVPAERLLQTPVYAVESLVGGLNQIAQGRSQLTAGQTLDWLRNKGIELWQSFIPADLQRQFWNLQGQIKRIMVVSDLKGDPVPWELLYPFRPGVDDDGGFFAERFFISRWISPADPPAPKLQLARAAFIEPSTGTDLPRAHEEIEAIRRLVGSRGAQAGESISDLTSLLDLLKAGDFNLLHFACHNSYQAARIVMGGVPFEPVFLREHQGRYADTSPLVFLNACRSDVQSPSYTVLDGWARAFLNTGAGAFVGTSWVVRDETAGQFAQTFYDSLLGPRPHCLGEALQEARKAIRDAPGDPTWLAYTLYGDTTAAIA
jgi:DNA-directed RNA polymerase specialized sigma24 family protein